MTVSIKRPQLSFLTHFSVCAPSAVRLCKHNNFVHLKLFKLSFPHALIIFQGNGTFFLSSTQAEILLDIFSTSLKYGVWLTRHVFTSVVGCCALTEQVLGFSAFHGHCKALLDACSSGTIQKWFIIVITGICCISCSVKQLTGTGNLQKAPRKCKWSFD